ncbi:uncharacterized protein LOC113796591 [Dermatophagoides pteronyssinus]|uniref:uncharacterized protein LOC113796591 n=1 Tax=Dermatophagoides pteronyssinus TaxID=6956 RepID=UPI003F67734C
MFKIFVIAASITMAYGSGYGMGGGGASGMSAGNGGGGGGGYGGMGGGMGETVNLAVKSNHRVSYREVESQRMVKPITVEIGAMAIPINMIFRSQSSALNVKQEHQSAAGSNQESQSEDEPHILKHTVKKPIYQEVYEVITPYRKITQEIKPVEEEIKTLIAKQSMMMNGGGMGGGYGGGMSAAPMMAAAPKMMAAAPKTMEAAPKMAAPSMGGYGGGASSMSAGSSMGGSSMMSGY